MEEELEGIWGALKLTEAEMEMVEQDNDQETRGMEEGKTWMVGKLLTNRPFNKDAMLSTLKVVWKISRDVVVTVLDSNLFLFKFATIKDKQRVIEGSPWSFNKHLIAFKDCNGELRGSDYKFDTAQFWIRIYGLPLKMLTVQSAPIISMKLGELIKTDIGSGDFLRVRDITKPLQGFITAAGVGGKGHIWGRLGYERLPMFCYECGMIGHSEFECLKTPIEHDTDITSKQYGDWLRVSLLTKGNHRWNDARLTSSEMLSKIENKLRESKKIWGKKLKPQTVEQTDRGT